MTRMIVAADSPGPAPSPDARHEARAESARGRPGLRRRAAPGAAPRVPAGSAKDGAVTAVQRCIGTAAMAYLLVCD